MRCATKPAYRYSLMEAVLPAKRVAVLRSVETSQLATRATVT